MRKRGISLSCFFVPESVTHRYPWAGLGWGLYFTHVKAKKSTWGMWGDADWGCRWKNSLEQGKCACRAAPQFIIFLHNFLIEFSFLKKAAEVLEERAGSRGELFSCAQIWCTPKFQSRHFEEKIYCNDWGKIIKYAQSVASAQNIHGSI